MINPHELAVAVACIRDPVGTGGTRKFALSVIISQAPPRQKYNEGRNISECECKSDNGVTVMAKKCLWCCAAHQF